jgi:hypothetical protein
LLFIRKPVTVGQAATTLPYDLSPANLRRRRDFLVFAVV